MAYERAALKTLLGRVKEKRRFIQVILGPRQVGKTTLVTQMLEKIKTPRLFVSADIAANSGSVWIAQQWQNARQMMAQSRSREFILVIDEIQKIDNWSERVKALWDEDTRNKTALKVILLGSSRLLLQQGLTESLAGRFETTHLGHWSFREMQDAFGWDEKKYIWFGGYPGSASLVRDEDRWKNYVTQSLIESSISRDILMLTRVDKPALMKRLFELGCLYSGQILSYTKMLGQLQDKGNTITLSHYLLLLDTAGLLAGIEKYAAEAVRQRSSSPKFLVYNTALISAQMTEKLKEAHSRHELWGRLVESAVGAHLLNHSVTGKFDLFYWRHRDDEVDFVLKQGRKIIALEVKSGYKAQTSGMSTFDKMFKPEKTLLVGAGGLPIRDFLLTNPADLF